MDRFSQAVTEAANRAEATALLIRCGYRVYRPEADIEGEDAARYVGISTAKFDACVKDGRMPQPFRIDACVIWDLRSLDAAFDALSGTSELNTFSDWS